MHLCPFFRSQVDGCGNTGGTFLQLHSVLCPTNSNGPSLRHAWRHATSACLAYLYSCLLLHDGGGVQVAPLCTVRVSGVTEGQPENVLSSEPDAWFETDESGDPMPWVQVVLPSNVKMVHFHRWAWRLCVTSTKH